MGYSFEFVAKFFFSWFDIAFEGGQFSSVFDDVDFVFDHFAELLQLLAVLISHLYIIHMWKA